jgi:hypothetical protein
MAMHPLNLLSVYSLTAAQQQIIVNVATRPPEYQSWFVEQFTRNRAVDQSGVGQHAGREAGTRSRSMGND